MNDQEYSYLTKKILELINIDLCDYKANQMRRRLDGFVARSNISGIVPFCDMLERDEATLNKLRDFLTINVSEFFRDLNYFETLQTTILPKLLRHNPNLNLWSAGCSNGAEAYSVAIILERLSPYGDHNILATDIDDSSLMKAIAGGPYRPAEIKNAPRQFVKKYFTSSDESYITVDRIRQKVVFRKHDLLHDRYERDFDLIMCRNVVIYFSDETKRKLNRNFHNSLKENGVLFIGGTETMPDTNDIGFEKLQTCFYRKLLISTQNKAPLPRATLSKA